MVDIEGLDSIWTILTDLVATLWTIFIEDFILSVLLQLFELFIGVLLTGFSNTLLFMFMVGLFLYVFSKKYLEMWS